MGGLFTKIFGRGSNIYMHLDATSDFLLLFLMFVSTLLYGLVPPVTAVLTGRIFQLLEDYAIGTFTSKNAFMRELELRSMTLLIVGFGGLPLCWATLSSWMLLGERQGFRVRRRLLGAYLSKTMAWYDTNENLEGDFTQIHRGVEELRSSAAESSAVTFLNAVTVVTLLTTSLYFSWSLTLVILASTPLIIALAIIFSKLVEKYTELENTETSHAASILTWSMEAPQLIRLFGTEQVELQKFSISVKKCSKFFINLSKYAAANQASLRGLSLIMFVQGFWFGNTMIKRGKLNSGQVITCFSACILLGTTLNNTLQHIVIMQKGKVALQKILSMVESESDALRGRRGETFEIFPSPISGMFVSPVFPKQITFENVSFSYPSRPNEYALDNVSLTFYPEKITFIVGKSGSGKSTLSNLLLKLYSDYEGTIKVGTLDIRATKDSWLLENITLVEQSCTLFNDSLLNNLLLTAKDDNKNEASIKRACQMALLEKLLFDLPDGLSTVIGSNGISLSGGQQQRVALARAILRDTPVLILDESISALDIIHRDLLMEVIRNWRAGKTTIILTHELSHILDDDYLYLMEDGKVGEHGYKRDLLSYTSGRFTELHNAVIPSDPSAIEASHEKAIRLNTEETTGSGIVSEESEEEDNTVVSYDTRRFSLAIAGNESMMVGSRIFSLRLSSYFQGAIMPDEHVYSSTMKGRNKRLVNTREVTDEGRVDLEKKLEERSKPVIMTIWTIICKMYATVNRLYMLWGLTFSALAGIINPVFSYTFSKLLSGVVPKNDGTGSPPYLMKWSLVVICVSVTDGCFTFLKKFILSVCSELWIMSLRIKAMDRISNQDVHWFSLDINKPSEISALILNDLRDLRYLVSGFLSAVTTLIFVSAIGLAWAFVSGWKLSLVCISTIPLFIGVTGIYGGVLQKYETDYKTAVAELENNMFEFVKGIKTVRCLQLESHFSNKYTMLEEGMKHQSRRRAVVTGFGVALSNALVIGVQAILYYYGIKLVVDGEYTPDNLLQTFTLLVFTIMTCSALMYEVPSFSRGRRAATYVFRILNTRSDFLSIDDDFRTEPIEKPSHMNPLIRIQDLTFAYPSALDVEVYKKLSLTINFGENLAIVGESGSGKSTMGLILCGLYPVNGNTVFIDDTDICKWNLSSLRKHISMVEQKAKFFDGSIRDNLIYGLDRIVTDSQIFEVLSLVGIADFVKELPQGLNTRIDTNLISGGQAQRISIGRALLRQPKLLILDECTSSLDAKNAQAIASLVGSSLYGITTIVITHNTQMMKSCNRILFFKNGRISEEGTFQELSDSRRDFYRMITSGEA
ncbi:ATP-binding cassette a-factor transporter STE6 Ecym_3612 [Eremothecium cymbalariae DBVPG|uniref:Uncharacterized protein n=1 Tax=Eremothecium cymbalariae (strain CBS 270.75 / DBVPG 7215 / KCTC 17166 / NRRL Y-17582) TaxID=931890 RepID=G8JQT9_ERECY|nr:Hypothetical protein Ecym_3612 [Eremothecium cymbalariae DBVPG\